MRPQSSQQIFAYQDCHLLFFSFSAPFFWLVLTSWWMWTVSFFFSSRERRRRRDENSPPVIYFQQLISYSPLIPLTKDFFSELKVLLKINNNKNRTGIFQKCRWKMWSQGPLVVKHSKPKHLKFSSFLLWNDGWRVPFLIGIWGLFGSSPWVAAGLVLERWWMASLRPGQEGPGSLANVFTSRLNQMSLGPRIED